MPRPLWHYERGISRTASDILSLRSLGISNVAPELMRLVNIQNELLAKLGVKIPKPMTLLLKLVGLSPGELKLFHDAEGGFFTEARSKPGAPPVIRYIDNYMAARIINRELTHAEFELLKMPSDYGGE